MTIKHTDELCKQYIDHRNKMLEDNPNYTWGDTAEFYGETLYAIKSAVKKYNKRMAKQVRIIDQDEEMQDEEDYYENEIPDYDNETDDDEPVVVKQKKENIDHYFKGISDDSLIWKQALHDLPSTIRFAYLTDVHLPDHDERAIDIALKIISDFKPHIVQGGSDIFDFATVSNYASDAHSQAEDVFDIVTDPFLELNAKIDQAANNPCKPFLIGNHDDRLYKHIVQKSPQVAKTVMKTLVRLAREGNNLWLGNRFRHYNIGTLKVIHGRSIATHAAYVNGTLFPGFDVISGHVHRIGHSCKTGELGTTTSITTGCLCNLQPHYEIYTQNWQQGICLITIDRKNQMNYFENIVFNNYVAYWGGRKYKG